MQSPSQNRVIDPILTNHARGFRRQGMVGRILFPRAGVSSYGGQIIEFGPDAFKLYNSRRAPGGATKRIEFGHQGKPYSITPSALEAKVPREHMQDASKVPGLNLGTRAVNLVLAALGLEHEYNSAQLATNPANYAASNKTALVGTARWTNAASTPSKDIETAREAIRAKVGTYPNTVLLSAKAMSALNFHAEILDRVKHTSIQSVTTDLLAKLWQVDQVIVGGATTADDAGAFSDIWGADVVVAYVSPGAEVNANIEEPSFGYTYEIEGHPLVEVPYWDNNAKSWIYGVSDDNAPVLSGMAAGYLIEDAGL